MKMLIQNLDDFSENNRLEKKWNFLLSNMNSIMSMVGMSL